MDCPDDRMQSRHENRAIARGIPYSKDDHM